MGYSELEVEVTVASANERQQLWISALPGIRPGRRLRIDHPSEAHRWWRIIEVGQIRLREASVGLELAH